MRTKHLMIEVLTSNEALKNKLDRHEKLVKEDVSTSIFKSLKPLAKGKSLKEGWGLVADHVFTARVDKERGGKYKLVIEGWGYDGGCPRPFLNFLMKKYDCTSIIAEWVTLNGSKVKVGSWVNGEAINGRFSFESRNSDYWYDYWTSNLELIDFETIKALAVPMAFEDYDEYDVGTFEEYSDCED